MLDCKGLYKIKVRNLHFILEARKTLVIFKINFLEKISLKSYSDGHRKIEELYCQKKEFKIKSIRRLF